MGSSHVMHIHIHIYTLPHRERGGDPRLSLERPLPKRLEPIKEDDGDDEEDCKSFGFKSSAAVSESPMIQIAVAIV